MTSDIPVRRIRIAPGVRDANRKWQESKPESPHAAQRRAEREYAELMADCETHPGDPVAFNATEHCWDCDRDIPACEP